MIDQLAERIKLLFQSLSDITIKNLQQKCASVTVCVLWMSVHHDDATSIGSIRGELNLDSSPV